MTDSPSLSKWKSHNISIFYNWVLMSAMQPFYHSNAHPSYTGLYNIFFCPVRSTVSVLLCSTLYHGAMRYITFAMRRSFYVNNYVPHAVLFHLRSSCLLSRPVSWFLGIVIDYWVISSCYEYTRIRYLAHNVCTPDLASYLCPTMKYLYSEPFLIYRVDNIIIIMYHYYYLLLVISHMTSC